MRAVIKELCRKISGGITRDITTPQRCAAASAPVAPPDFSTASTFISAADGNWNDGATWGGDSPGVWGRDYPGPEDTVEIKHHVVVPSGKELAGQVKLADGAHLDIKGSFTLEADLICGNLAAITVDHGELRLNGFGIDTEKYYRVFDFSTRHARITGPGIIGKKQEYRYSLGHFTIEDSVFDGLSGFFSCGNYSHYYAPEFQNRLLRSRFINCSGKFELQYMDKNGEQPAIVQQVFFEGFDKMTFGGSPQQVSILDRCVFADAGEVYLKQGWQRKNMVAINTTFIPKGRPQNCLAEECLLVGLPGSGSEVANFGHDGAYRNCYFYTAKPNPHLLVIDGDYMPAGGSFFFSNNIIEAASEVDDGGDFLMLREKDALPITATGNILIDKTGGAFINGSGGIAHPAIVSGENNTIYSNRRSQGYYGFLARNESGGYFLPEGQLHLHKNIVYNTEPTSPKTAAVYLLKDDADQLTTTDDNAFINLTDPYVGVTITGKSLGEEGFGKHDRINIDPQFVDPTRNLAAYDAHLGGEGTAEHAIAEFSRIADADYSGAYSVSGLLEYVRAGFRPQAAEYQLNNGEYIGAVNPQGEEG